MVVLVGIFIITSSTNVPNARDSTIEWKWERGERLRTKESRRTSVDATRFQATLSF